MKVHLNQRSLYNDSQPCRVKNDLYIIKPQTSKIVANNMYNFEIEQYPSKGLNSGSGLMNQDFKLVIESPSENTLN